MKIGIMGTFELIGLILSIIATCLSFSALLHQTISIYRTRETKSLSFTTFVIMFVCSYLWMMNNSFVQAITGLVSSTLSCTMTPLVIYLIYRNLGHSRMRAMIISIILITMSVSLFVFGVSNYVIGFVDFKGDEFKWIKFTLSFTAGFIGTLIFIPQIIKSYRMKDAKNVSGPMIIFYMFSQNLWNIFWLSRHFGDPAYANLENWFGGFFFGLISFLLYIVLLIIKIKYGRKTKVAA